ncbi:MAG: hypothetical protein GPJ54_14335 [Candidatus Heimdallarchaeota archaeon]|nr:hypothetical protein [Candidatus Heimdallarchaeota archaeon]
MTIATFTMNRKVKALFTIIAISYSLNIVFTNSIVGDSNDVNLVYSTFLGGSEFDDGYSTTSDLEGNIYVAGMTTSLDFPVLSGFDKSNLRGGVRTAFVAKFSPDGDLLFTSLLGGQSHDTASAIAINSENEIIVVGITRSSDFFTTLNAYGQIFNGKVFVPGQTVCCGDAFLTIISGTGSEILYSSFIGGSGAEADIGLVLDKEDNIYISGITTSADFPITSGSYQIELAGGFDSFVSKFTPNGTNLIYSTYIGGAKDEIIRGGGVNGHNVGIDKDNNIYLTGGTKSDDFPTTADAYNDILAGSQDAYYLKLANNGSKLLYSTLFGGQFQDVGWGLDVNSDNSVHIVGLTDSPEYPTSSDAFQSEYIGGCSSWSGLCGDSFLTVFSQNDDMSYSTFFGGDKWELFTSVGIDNFGRTIISGFTESSNFPLMDGYQTEYGGGLYDGSIVIFDENLTLIYSTYLGGSIRELTNDVTITELNDIYVTGWSRSSEFPVSDNAYDSSPDANGDMVLVKFQFSQDTDIESSTTPIASSSISSSAEGTTSLEETDKKETPLLFYGVILALITLNLRRKYYSR